MSIRGTVGILETISSILGNSECYSIYRTNLQHGYGLQPRPQQSHIEGYIHSEFGEKSAIKRRISLKLDIYLEGPLFS